jgi:hypothetical protein
VVGILRHYLNRADLLYDLQEAKRQLDRAAEDASNRSVKNVRKPSKRPVRNRLSDEDVRELVRAFESGTATRLELGARYGIGRTSVARLLREHRSDGRSRADRSQ